MNIDKKTLRLYAVTDRTWLDGRTLYDDVEKALKGGVTLLQLREKNMSTDDFINSAKEIKSLCEKYNIPLIINDNVDVAKAVNADGVHIGQNDMPAHEARKILGKNKIIGVTAKTVEQAQKAEKDGADYLGSGAIFGTTTKGDAKKMDMQTLKSITSSVNIPVVAIGGIDGDNVLQLKGTGIVGAAVVSGIFAQDDIEIITKNYMERMLTLCGKENTGAVGAKLYYPDDTIQHAGIVIGIGGHARGIAANMCVGQVRSDSGYMYRASLRQNLSAATAAFLMVPAKVFREVDGFCEALSVAFNDVDLCLKIRKKGYLIIYEPSVEAYHYESKSRGQEDTEEKVRRFQEEIEYMRTRWIDILKQGDPYYHPGLTRYRTDYSLGQKH